ncbi:DUF6585 family protein [Nocardia sp. NPDC005998]|uniref:DUF6585 family protein n=1 Tax=Nocardia sp. NPDC005998 TaxID=3156894 RepID=UPI0033A7AD4F
MELNAGRPGANEHEAAVGAGLGAHRASYLPVAPGWRRYRGMVIVTAVGWAVLLGSMAGGFVVGEIFAGVFAVMFSGRLLWDLVRLRYFEGRNRGSRLELFQRGFVVAFRGEVRAFRYDTTSVLQNIVRHNGYGTTIRITYAYTCTDVTGAKVVVRSGFERPEEWGPAIQQAVTDAQLPSTAAAIDAGQRLDFGDVWMTSGLVGSGGKSVAWSEIEEIRVRDGLVSLRVAGQWRALTTTPVRYVPNFFVFLALAQDLRRRNISG